ncbi:hypothetical protein H311_00485 [Anncaliia algerae PRA109]|nr:hypothetical protein H311_00485 [Anncaliia algerae PRA109]
MRLNINLKSSVRLSFSQVSEEQWLDPTVMNFVFIKRYFKFRIILKTHSFYLNFCYIYTFNSLQVWRERVYVINLKSSLFTDLYYFKSLVLIFYDFRLFIKILK